MFLKNLIHFQIFLYAAFIFAKILTNESFLIDEKAEETYKSNFVFAINRTSINNLVNLIFDLSFLGLPISNFVKCSEIGNSETEYLSDVHVEVSSSTDTVNNVSRLRQVTERERQALSVTQEENLISSDHISSSDDKKNQQNNTVAGTNSSSVSDINSIISSSSSNEVKTNSRVNPIVQQRYSTYSQNTRRSINPYEIDKERDIFAYEIFKMGNKVAFAPYSEKYFSDTDYFCNYKCESDSDDDLYS